MATTMESMIQYGRDLMPGIRGWGRSHTREAHHEAPEPARNPALPERRAMLAVLGFVLAVVGMILKLVDKHGNWIIWLLLVGLALVCAEVAWGWHRGGYYRRTP